MKELYFRCNGGHYFRDALACPFDGWSIDGVERALQRFSELRAEGLDPTLELLSTINASAELTNRMLIVEFGDSAVSFEALVPERYLFRGRMILLEETGLVLK